MDEKASNKVKEINKDKILKQLPIEPISGIYKMGNCIFCISRLQALNICDFLNALGLDVTPHKEDGECWIEFN